MKSRPATQPAESKSVRERDALGNAARANAAYADAAEGNATHEDAAIENATRGAFGRERDLERVRRESVTGGMGTSMTESEDGTGTVIGERE